MKNASYFIITVGVHMCCQGQVSLQAMTTIEGLAHRGSPGCWLISCQGSCNAPGHCYTTQKPVLHLDEST